jgi:predicted DNA-binding antitoxin AbrB/MazE fold protein
MLRQGGIEMSITIEAIYEAGVLRPLQPLPDFQENERVLVTVETEDIIEQQIRERLILPPEVLHELMENEEYSLLNC